MLAFEVTLELSARFFHGNLHMTAHPQLIGTRVPPASKLTYLNAP